MGRQAPIDTSAAPAANTDNTTSPISQGNAYGYGGPVNFAGGGIIGTDDSNPSFSGSDPTEGMYGEALRQSLGYAGGGCVGRGHASGGVIPGTRDPESLRIAGGHLQLPSSTVWSPRQGQSGPMTSMGYMRGGKRTMNPELDRPPQFHGGPQSLPAPLGGSGTYQRNLARRPSLPGGGTHITESGSMRRPAYV